MALDTSFIGHTLAPYTVPVEAGRLKFFAKATGQVTFKKGLKGRTFISVLPVAEAAE